MNVETNKESVRTKRGSQLSHTCGITYQQTHLGQNDDPRLPCGMDDYLVQEQGIDTEAPSKNDAVESRTTIGERRDARGGIR